MKTKVLKEIDSFSSLLCTCGKMNAAESIKKLFTYIVNQSWYPDKDNATNLETVMSSLIFSKSLNEYRNNYDIVKLIDIFMSNYLSKFWYEKEQTK